MYWHNSFRINFSCDHINRSSSSSSFPQGLWNWHTTIDNNSTIEMQIFIRYGIRIFAICPHLSKKIYRFFVHLGKKLKTKEKNWINFIFNIYYLLWFIIYYDLLWFIIYYDYLYYLYNYLYIIILLFYYYLIYILFII